MRESYTGRRNRTSRRRRGFPLFLAGLILGLAVGAALYFTGLLPDRAAKEPKTPQEQTNPEPADPTPVDPTPVDPEPVDPTPVDPEPTDPDGYEKIELTGEQEQYETTYRIGDTGFEMFTYLPEVAEKYAAAVNSAAEKLQGLADVYVVMVPLSSGVTLPDELLGSQPFGDQKRAEEGVTSMLGDQVRTVPLYNVLMSHRTEYIYFRTDHHWTALGAYYGYRAFCEAKGITPHELTDYREEEFSGFLGTFYQNSNKNKQMGDNPDTVVAYHPVTTTARLVFTDMNGQETPWMIIYPVESWSADSKYNTFIGGDKPYTIITNPEVEDDSACVVVKDSFGNAMVPYLVDHYHTVHVIDYRYWNGDLTAFVRESGAKDVLFINNLSSIRNSFLMGRLREMIG